MDLAVLATVKARLQADGTTLGTNADRDIQLSAFITQVSTEFEVRLTGVVDGLKAQARTEYYDLDHGQRVILLRAWPVSALTSLHIDQDREFDATASLVDDADYYTNLRLGYVELLPYYVSLLFTNPGYPAPGAVKVVYTAGFGATAAAVESAYPMLASAVADQVIHMWRRRGSFGSTAVSSGQGSQVSYQGPVAWLPSLESALKALTRSRVG